MTNLITCSNEDLEIGVLPEVGASLAFFRRKKGTEKTDIMRPTSPTNLNKKDVNGVAMFPMLPYTNRIRDGKFIYWGITRYVPKNQAGVNDPIHGDGWKSKWTVEEQTSTSVRLSLMHKKEDKGFPFAYKAVLTYELKGKELVVTTELTNEGGLPMPCGFGLNPFFPKTPHVELAFSAKSIWYHENDPITRPYPVPEGWSFEEQKRLGDAIFDTCFGSFDGKATIWWPRKDLSLTIEADDMFGHAVLYAPYHKGFFCVEPCSMCPDAFNMASNGVVGTGIKSVGPSESITGVVSFKVS